MSALRKFALAVVLVAVLLGAPAALAQAYPSGAMASSGNVANAVASAALPAVAGKTNYLTGVMMTSGGATAAAVVTCTITGLLGGTVTFIYGAPLGVGLLAQPLAMPFPYPLPASAPNVAVTASCPALGLGNTNAAISVLGFAQ